MRNELDLWRPLSTLRSGWPFRDFENTTNRLFGDLLDLPSFVDDTAIYPSCDFDESDSAYMISMDVPGIAKEDLKVEVTGTTLTISGERKYEHKEKTRTMQAAEKRFGRFRRSFTLPNIAHADKIEAAYENGVLKLHIPKSEEAKPKQIKIGEGKGIFKGLFSGKEKEAQKIPVQ